MLLYIYMQKFKLSLNFSNIWLSLCLFISVSSLVYLVYALNSLGLIISFLVSGFLYYLLRVKQEKTNENLEMKTTPVFWIYASISLIAIIATIILTFLKQSDQALISPWILMDPWFWLSLFISSLALIFALSLQATAKYKKILLALYYLSIFSIAAIIYKLGYGFDPFIHQAAMAEIDQSGYILPKTPYYLGQYSLIIALHKISGLSIFILNKYFLPVFSAIFLTPILALLQGDRQDKGSGWLATLFLLFLGFSPLILTTPQNFSYLLLLAVVVFIYKQLGQTLIFSTALATFAVHPLAGIPAIFIASLFFLLKKYPNLRIIQLIKKPFFIFSGAVLVFCLSLWAVSGFSSLSLQKFNLSLLNPVLANTENYLLNISYALINNYFWLILLAVIIIIFKQKNIWSKKRIEDLFKAQTLALIALATLSAYLISRGFSFNNLISYEQGDYAARLPLIALIISLPLFWELFYYLSKQARRLNKSIQILGAIGLALILSITVYASYPRLDHYYNSRGYSTGATDVIAVNTAEQRAQGQNYIVLANQQVSAAALREFGFRDRYLNINGKQLYFYPIPTGSQLYPYFLEMVYEKADRSTMIEAMDLAQVKRAYLIINKYWWASDKIIAEAKMSADYWEKINNGEDYLFEYLR